MKTSAKKQKRIELLFEIGCEEIPAGMLPRAEEELQASLEKLLAVEDLLDGVSVETFAGPRRLTAWVKGLLRQQADAENEVTGPPKSVAYDAVGAPTRAAMSFAEKLGVSLGKIHFVQTPKGEYLAVKLIKLVNAPCNCPCSLGAICVEIIPCKAGPAKPPIAKGIIKANIIQLCDAKEKARKPQAEQIKPRYKEYFVPIFGPKSGPKGEQCKDWLIS